MSECTCETLPNKLSFFLIAFGPTADYDKMIKLNDHTLMLTSGEIGDCTNFGEYVQKNVQLHQIRNGMWALSICVC